MINTHHLLILLLVNLPAYVCGGLALWRKTRDENYYAAFVLAILLALIVIDGVCVSQIFYVETASPLLIKMQATVSILIVPVLYIFNAPEGGQDVLNRTTVFLFLATLLMLMPAVSWDLMPAYSLVKYVVPQEILGISIFYKGQFLYHLYWMAIILTLQSYIALTQLKKLYKMVVAHGARYSLKAKATYYWEFSCGYFLSLSFLVPLNVWQTPTMRWIYYITSAIFIGVGCFLIFLGFDINPIVDHQRNSTSLSEFMLENGALVKRMRAIMEDEKVYLEPGIQSETVAQRLETSHAYFLKMVRVTYGCSFPEWINRQRIEYSKELLQQNMSFERVSNMCGYSSTFAFLRMFMRINNGQTASAYCRSLGNAAPIYRPKQTYDDDE